MKATEPSLSLHLLAEARRFVLYPNRVRKQHDAAAIINEILDRFVEAQEWVVSDADFGKLAPDPKLRRLTCDEVYSKALLEKVPKMAERTVRVGVLSTVLHQRQAVEEDAWKAITDLRAVLAHLYGVTPSERNPTLAPKQP